MPLSRRSLLFGAVVVGAAGLPLLAGNECGGDVEGPLHARVIGDGEPILFVHGLAASGAYWGDAYDAFARVHRLAFVDLAGFGGSLRVPGPFDVEGQLARLSSFREQRLGGGRITIVGHSFGALLALLAASRWENVRGGNCELHAVDGWPASWSELVGAQPERGRRDRWSMPRDVSGLREEHADGARHVVQPCRDSAVASDVHRGQGPRDRVQSGVSTQRD
ncbi:MAG: alpha/beta fold hydrolase [Deltaproteobacteria bacterium]|nr:alpha/beta fold hydrolase [Deltaproteobacteria bacterium]